MENVVRNADGKASSDDAMRAFLRFPHATEMSNIANIGSIRSRFRSEKEPHCSRVDK